MSGLEAAHAGHAETRNPDVKVARPRRIMISALIDDYIHSVVELAGDGGPAAVAGDVAADVGGGDAGLGAQRRDDRVVDVVLGDRLGADAEQDVRVLAGPAV
jgi:hypothetical protein